MIVNIYSAVFIITLILCIRIPTSDSVDETPSVTAISQNDEDNQTVTIDQQSTQINNDSILSDSNLKSIESDVSSSDENNLPNENQLDTTTTDEPSSTPPVPVNHSHIDSFEEWKQQQLHAEASKKENLANTPSTSSETPVSNPTKGSSGGSSSNFQQISSPVSSSKKGKLRKNFASASCGAKILAHNTEAQNVGSILSSSPDEYMLNPCNVKIWFVIELCESIRILNIEIANFELFSSVPKTFRVSASDRYPTKDWHRHQLGTFNASFNRTIQGFQTIESTTYLKYLKFELIDFHGHEHYCPLSVVRIHGSNVEDEIMTMEEITNQNEAKPSTDIQDENENEDDDEADDLSNDQQVGGIIGSAIFDLAKRVFRRQTIRGTQSTTTHPILETNDLKTECHPKVFNHSLTNENLRTWRKTDQFKQCIANFLFGLWSTFNTCTIYFSQICFQMNYCCQCPLMTTNQHRVHRLQSSINFYIHPCGYYHILTSHSICQQEKIIEMNKTDSVNEQTQDLVDEQPVNQTTVLTDDNKRDAILSTNQSLLNLTVNQSNETIDQPVTTTNSTEQPSIIEITNETIPIVDTQVSPNTTDETISSSPQTNVSDSNSIEIEQVHETSTENNNPVDETVTSTPTAADVIPPLIASPWLKGMLVNTKSLPELFKIIEKLNFNLTLSNRYLQELSQHYVKKLDETQHTTDLLRQSSKAADEKLAYLEEQVLKFHDNFSILSERLTRLEAYNAVFVLLIMCLLVWCFILNCRITRLKSKYRIILSEFDEMKKLKQLDEEDDDEPPVFVNGQIKRRLSTDSSDSNPTRSQRVPDGYLTKITENGLDQIEHKLNGVSSIVNQKK